MNTARDAKPALSRLRPLAAALLLGLAWSDLGAVTAIRPGEMPASLAPATSHALREDGTPLRTSLRAWHQDALAHAASPSPNVIHRLVTSCADDGPGSLRQVISASASGDTVDLGTLSCARITLETGAIPIRVESLNLVGPASRLTIDALHADRVFLHYGYAGFLIRNLIIANGRDRATGSDLAIGGCIASAGYLTLDHSTVTGCYAAGEGAYGGGIYAYSLIMSASTLSNNIASGAHPSNFVASFGGAAFVYQFDMVASTVTSNRAAHQPNQAGGYDIGGGVATIHGGLIVNSTIDTNYSYGRGGGLATFDDLFISNSTISGNTGRTIGGGGLFIRYPALLDARNSTIASNTGRNGGGILFTSRTASMSSTIVADNAAFARESADLAASRTLTIDGANNLITASASETTLPADTLREDADLLPLRDNGGPTRTQALRPGSAAINAGNNAARLASDQRGTGFARVVGPAADIGAFELGATAADAGPVALPALSQWTAALLCALLALFARRRIMFVRRKIR